MEVGLGTRAPLEVLNAHPGEGAHPCEQVLQEDVVNDAVSLSPRVLVAVAEKVIGPEKAKYSIFPGVPLKLWKPQDSLK